MKIVPPILYINDTLSSPHSNPLGKNKRDLIHSGVKLQANIKTGVNNNYRPARSASFGGSAGLEIKTISTAVQNSSFDTKNTSFEKGILNTSNNLKEITFKGKDNSENKHEVATTAKNRQAKKNNTKRNVIIAIGGAIAIAGGALFVAYKKGVKIPNPFKAINNALHNGVKSADENSKNPLNFIKNKIAAHKEKTKLGAMDADELKNLPWAEYMEAKKGEATKAGKFIMNHKGLKKAINFAFNNEAMFSAFMTFGIGMLIKPAFVLAMPGADKEDKQMIATKNIISAVISFVLSNIIMNPVSNGVKEVLKDPEKYIKVGKNASEGRKKIAESFIEMLKSETKLKGHKTDMKEAFKSVVKNAPDIAIAATKSAITIALIPVVLKMLFPDTNKKDKKPLPLQFEILKNLNNSKEEDKQVFKKVSGGLKL